MRSLNLKEENGRHGPLMVTLPVPPKGASKKSWERWHAKCDAFYTLQALEYQQPIRGACSITAHVPYEMGDLAPDCINAGVSWMQLRGLIVSEELAPVTVVLDDELHKMMWILVRQC